ncbi:NAD(P)/FAD-dependent oxidoreductase [Nocardia sp. NPDC051570]|uniref:NAD(P)/FAD-dependent oxidoreductase n=1 Tax=Nocardia sp. NPDC051570 TaxID=3364324 RepID=UPI0037AFF5DF
MMQNHYPTDSPAVVIGAGIAGLLAAQVLACHRFRVVLVDRDRLPSQPQRRTGVPQGDHVHALFARGLRAVEARLPGFGTELCQRGGQRIDVGRDLTLVSRHGVGLRFPSDLEVIGASRPLIEAVIRERVVALPRVRLRDHHHAAELIGTSRHVNAVRVQDRTTGQLEDVPAALVVEAGGRGSALSTWFTQLGCPTVPETIVDAHVGYATRIYRRNTQGPQRDWQACYALPLGPVTTRGGVLAPIEGDRWIVTLNGVGQDRPPTDDEQFVSFARGLSTPLIADAIANAEPLTSVRRSSTTANRRRHFDRVANQLPDNVFAIGDSACIFNPVYAQGMTVAALDAHLLDACLRGGRTAAKYHRKLSALHDVPWLLATTSDFRFPTTDSPADASRHRLLGDYFERVVAAGTDDPLAQVAFLNVLNMVQHPVRLLNPRLAVHVTRHHHRPRRAGPRPASTESGTHEISAAQDHR